MTKRKEITEIETTEIESLIERVEQGQLADGDRQLIGRLLRTVLVLISILQQKNATIGRLKRIIFGSKSEKLKGKEKKAESEAEEGGEKTEKAAPEGSGGGSVESQSAREEASAGEPKKRRKGHGRMSWRAYSGAEVVKCRNAELEPGDRCSYCGGAIYDTGDPKMRIKLYGAAPISAVRYEQERLRCSSCQQRYQAPLPEGVSEEKFDRTADVAIVMTKYALGVPSYRLEQQQKMAGAPLPASEQFERSEAVADALLPIFRELEQAGADGRLLHIDDTRVRILSCLKENQQQPEEERRATQTTGLVIETAEGRKIVLYRSGRKHAGENADQLLQKRSEGLSIPLQMSDALAANAKGERVREILKCLVHGRRQFSEIAGNFPVECRRVLEAIAKVYRFEGETEGMSADERLKYHQTQSGPVMNELREWVEQQVDERRVEPNSGLGKAFKYLLKHWEGLTKFLSIRGAPLDNNLVERALKRAVLLRKNILFYKNEHGAAIGDLLLSLIETCRHNGVNAWQYLLAVYSRAEEVRKNPTLYLPWNYQEAVEERARAA
jgi:transposase